MNKTMLMAVLMGTLATAVVAQPAAPQDARAAGATAEPSAGAPTSPDTRAADLERMMDIRNWQTGPSSGDAASRADVNAPAIPADTRTSDMQKMMEIRNWQAGPSAGDAATNAATKPSAPSTAIDFSKREAQDALGQAATQ
jgi:hypothetical protein